MVSIMFRWNLQHGASGLEVESGKTDLLDHVGASSTRGDSERFRSTPKTCRRFHGSLSVR
jgi:hypothetical protein